jgi:hypothetical protein
MNRESTKEAEWHTQASSRWAIPAAKATIAMFLIEDEIHAEQQGQYASFEEALAELKRRAKIPWDQVPNVAPCMSWKTCGREYVVIEFDDSCSPWKELQRVPVLTMSESSVKWSGDFQDIY